MSRRTNPKQNYEAKPIRPLFSTKAKTKTKFRQPGGGAEAVRGNPVYRQKGAVQRNAGYTMQHEIEKRQMVCARRVTAGQNTGGHLKDGLPTNRIDCPSSLVAARISRALVRVRQN